MKNVSVLNTGLFEAPFMNSRITTRSMTMREKVLGYLVGPMGLAIFVAMVMTLIELYYTSVIPIDRLYPSGTYLTISVSARIMGIVFGLILSWLIDHTTSSQGKIRPYVLVGSLLTIISGFALFFVPDIGSNGRLVWIFASFVVYNGIATIAYSQRVYLITLSSRNQLDRTQINLFNNMISYLVAGIMVGLLVSSLFYYIWLVNDPTGKNWVVMVGAAALFALPLLFVEYFYTKERVTLEDLVMHRSNSVYGK